MDHPRRRKTDIPLLFEVKFKMRDGSEIVQMVEANAWFPAVTIAGIHVLDVPGTITIRVFPRVSEGHGEDNGFGQPLR